MIPILYDRTETAFQSNGLGRLSDCITCTVTEERNGIYECQFEYPVNGVNFDLIEKGRIIACTHDEQGDIQPFDIYRKTEPINGIVTFYAHHISYRQNEIVVKPFTAGTCAEAFASLKPNSIGENPFSYWTDKSVSKAYANETPKTLRSLLMGEENSLLDVYGTGEYEFSRFEVRFSTRRGRDTNVSIRYGKNLVDFENDDNSENVYTAAVPFWLGDTEEGTVLIKLPEWSISSGHSVDSGREIYVPMDLSGSFSEQPTVSELRALATSRLAASNGWVPNQTMDVNFVQLWQTEEYKEVAALQRLRLCDTCGVFVPMYGISVRAKVISVTYNVLLDRYDSMTLGDKPVTYAAVIEKNFDSKVAGIVQGFQAIEVEISSVEKAASEDATNKANAAEQNAKNYADSSISDLKDELEEQIDAKIETWAQSTNPASAWTTPAVREEHKDDLWLYTGTSDMTVGGVTIKPQGVYKYSGSSNTWAAYSSTTNNLFDIVDGKTSIFYGTPSGTYSNVQTGDYLVDKTNGKTYRWSVSQWVTELDYNSAISALKDELVQQIDAKIETWAQSTNPASNWTTATVRAEHDGDLWLYTGTSNITVGGVTITPQGVYQYNGTSNTWSAYSSTSDNIFDLVDGKTTIFYGSPSGTYQNKRTGDYLVNSADGCTYRWNGSSWVKQTDYATAIANAKTTIEQEYAQAIEDATEQIRGGTGGYIVTTVNANGQPIELLITDNLDLNQAVNVWRWNQGGLGHSHNGYNGPFNDIAITQDGKINASLITTGTLTANIIRAGIISDVNNINSWNLETGVLAIQKGSINLGNGKFVATDEGKVTAIGGGLIRDPNSKTVFDLDSGLLTIKKGSINLGNGNFIATDAGKLTAIGGGLIRDGSSKTVFNLDTGYLKSEYGEFGPYSLGASGLQFSNAINFLALRSTEIVSTSKITWSGGRTSIMGVNFQKGKIAFVGRQNESNPENYDNQFVMDMSEWAPDSGTGGMFIRLKDKFGTELAKIDDSSATYPISFEESVRVTGNFYVQGTKSRNVKTSNYSDRLLYCYETPTPLFGDIGEATIDEDGMCYVDIDDIFSETVAEAVEYQVFLQAEGDGKCFVSEKTPRYFAIEGTPGLRVAWELKAKQKDYQNIRLEQAESKLEEYARPTDELFSVESYITEQEDLLYGYN